MHISFIFIAGLLLAHTQGALGGSRYWEAKAPNKRTNPIPDYPAIDTLNATSSLFKRAASIVNRPGDNEVPRIWPNKKIRYCFQDRNPNAIVRGLWDQAMELWAPLKWHGFSYEEVSNEVCQSQRSTVLRIHYNANGRLYSTLGIPVIDEEWNRNNPERAVWGPHTHLSDMQGIGQDDIAANVAHELGHIWGLFHEHQISSYWRLSTEHMADPWGLPLTSKAKSRFQTSGFNCRSLSDYDTAHAKVREKIDAAREKNDRRLQSKLETDLARLCISREAAQEHGFSAGDWLPKIFEFDMEKDAEFDPQSIMLYPSRAGGSGLGDQRAIVMVYEDNTLIPNRLAPSGQDIDRLLTLYGTSGSTPGEPHTSKSSKLRNAFKRVRSMNFRAGDTQAGLC